MSLRCTVLADLIGVDHLTTGFGMATLLEGVAALVGPVASGEADKT